MKLFKNTLLALFMIATTISAQAQNRGNYGTIQSWTTAIGSVYAIHSGTLTPVATDTLTDVDTGYVYFTFNNLYNHIFVLHVVPVTGTGAGTSLLQMSYDNSHWYTITGNTTYCTTCKGASATITNAVADYAWSIPVDVGAAMKYTRIQTISSGTVTMAYTANDYYGY